MNYSQMEINFLNNYQKENGKIEENISNEENRKITYKDCPILCKLKRKKEPLTIKVKLDEFTKLCQENFDYEFDGTSKIYPFELPNLPKNFKSMVITGSSGSGKSTLLKEFINYNLNLKTFDDNAIVSNFETPNKAIETLSAVGLNSIPVWCRPRKVLSVGEGFRADIALNLKSYTIFDEFTSTIDRNVAKSTCNGIRKYINKNNLTNIVFCSCHNDYIPFLKPDIVIDLDEEKVYDCRGIELGENLPYEFISLTKKTCGEYLGNIII